MPFPGSANILGICSNSSTGFSKDEFLCASIETYPLAEAAKAHEAFEQRQVSGRLLLLP